MTQKILVVEDEPAIVDNITYALETEGYEVVPTSTGQDALVLMGIFSLLTNIALSVSRIQIGRLKILKGTLIVAAIVTAEELSQLFVPGRNCSLSDLLFDYIGIVSFGWIACGVYASIHSCRER